MIEATLKINGITIKQVRDEGSYQYISTGKCENGEAQTKSVSWLRGRLSKTKDPLRRKWLKKTIRSVESTCK